MTYETTWDERAVSELRLLYANPALSFREITTFLNETCGTHYSRNAIIGKARRLGLTRELNPQPNRPRTIQVPGVKKPYRRRKNGKLAGHLVPSLQGQVGTSLPRAASRHRNNTLPEAQSSEDYNSRSLTTQGIAIDALSSDTCRWPLGEWGAYPPYEYCGRPPLEDGPLPYCEHHTRVAIRPGKTTGEDNGG